MTRLDAMTKNQPVYSADGGASIFSHPNRASMAQKFAGTGALVFEGELLEMPLQWHPAGTRH